MTGTATTTE